MPVLLVLAILAFGAKEGEATDDNGIFDPCVSLVKLKKKDGITLGVGLAGDVSSWYNSSSTNLNLLSPCSSQLAAFAGNASLIVYAGRNPTIVSKPRFFLYADGRVPALTLNLYFVEGKLTQMLWKDDSCALCYSKDQYCRDGSCVTKEADCIIADTSNSTITDYNCRLAIIVTFSGTDRYHQLLTTWYQLTNINRYSMASLFNAIEIGIQESLQRLDRG